MSVTAHTSAAPVPSSARPRHLVDLALGTAALGIPVFAVSRANTPLAGTHGHLDATTDPATIRKMFAKSGAHRVGFPTGPRSGIDILDIDPRHGGHEWEEENAHRIPETRIHQTRSGGRHYLLRHHAGVKNSAGRIASGVDVRGEGGFGIVAGSPGYTIISDADFDDWPGWLLVPGLALPAPEVENQVPRDAYKPAGERRIAAFISSLLDNVARAPEGGKHATLLANARTLGGVAAEAGFSDDEAVGWLLAALPSTVTCWKSASNTARWGLKVGRAKPITLEDRAPARSVQDSHHQQTPRPPGWEEGDPGPQAGDAGGNTDHGTDAPPDDTKPSLIDNLVAEFNARFMVVNEAGKAIIYEPATDPILKRQHYIRIEFGDLKRLFLNRRVCVGLDDKLKPILRPVADVWLSHPDRHQYIGGVTFDPSGKHVRPDTLNLWRGFAVKAKAGSWTRLLDHILAVICRGNQDHFDFLIGWMARLVQYPAEQGEVAVVMKGIEGAGKGILAKALLHIFGQHGLAISNSKHLTGNFNGHLRDTILLFADEAFFAGDRAHTGVLKSLVTEPFLTIEAKYQNAVQMPNFVHLMMASNEEWVVPASLEARRFFVLEVSPARANDHAYFGAILSEMKNGGHEAMLHDLLSYDLTFYNPRRVPVTEGLQQQRKLSLGTSEAWWLDCLHRGYVFKSRLGLEDYFADWHEEVSTEVLYASYEAFARDRHERHPMSRETFGRFMKETVRANPKRLLSAVVGEHIADVISKFGITSRQAETIKHPRPPGYHLGTLDASRRAFTNKTNLHADWPQP